jgi:O-antigen ligase
MMLLLLDIPKNIAIRVGLIVILVMASIEMASLGGILCTLTALAYWIPRRSKNLNFGKQVLPFFIAVLAPNLLQAFDNFTGLNRYGRSSEGRLSIWGDALKTWYEKPLGLGIGNFSDPNLQLTVAPEAHNDYISSLVEMGILGPLAIGAICLSIAMMGGLRTRTMVVFYLVSAISHNSINFRHIWVFMAICFAYDILPQLQPANKDEQVTHDPEVEDVQIYQLRKT